MEFFWWINLLWYDFRQLFNTFPTLDGLDISWFLRMLTVDLHDEKNIICYKEGKKIQKNLLEFFYKKK